MREFTCMSCYAVFDGEVQQDAEGYFAVCPECGASFPTDAPEEGGDPE